MNTLMYTCYKDYVYATTYDVPAHMYVTHVVRMYMRYLLPVVEHLPTMYAPKNVCFPSVEMQFCVFVEILM